MMIVDDVRIISDGVWQWLLVKEMLIMVADIGVDQREYPDS